MTTSTLLLPRNRVRERPVFVLTSLQQKLLGSFFILHGFAHATFGLWAATTGRLWLVTALWELATVGFVAAGFGALGLRPLSDWWRTLSIVGATGSFLLFLLVPHHLFVAGLLIDVIAIALVVYSQSPPRPVQRATPRMRSRIFFVLGWLSLIYVSGVIVLRPWDSRWGTTASERAMTLPGDQLVPAPNYQLDHGITINAPAAAVWPWLNQIGQERGGFYSYSSLENAAGARVTNVDRIVPQWPQRKVGDLVRSVPHDWLGGRFGDQLGWRVLQVVPNRALVLEGWGAFVLNPVNAGTTRMLIRTRGEGSTSLSGIALGPVTLLVFEPAHFIMQRKMLIGIKERAERTYLEENLIAR